MNKEAYEAGVKVALDKYGLSWEWMKAMYKKYPYLAPAAVSGTIGAGVGGLIGGPQEAFVGGLSGVGGSLLGTKAYKMLDANYAKRIVSGDQELIRHLRKDPDYIRRVLRLTQIGTTVGAGAGIDAITHTLLPREPHPLEKL